MDMAAVSSSENAQTNNNKTNRAGRSRRSNSDVPSFVEQGNFVIPPYNSAYATATPHLRGSLVYCEPELGNAPQSRQLLRPCSVTSPFPSQQSQNVQHFQLLGGVGSKPPLIRVSSDISRYQEIGSSTDPSLRNQRLQFEPGKSKSRAVRNSYHRKSRSGSAVISSNKYLWDAQPPGPSYREAPKHDFVSNNQKFSPHSDLRKLTQGLSPKQSHIKENNSTSSGARPSSLLPFGYHQNWCRRGYDTVRDSEAVFSQQRRSTSVLSPSFFDRTHHREPSDRSRKMHMRQQSVQIFMEDKKGRRQELKCRNVLFLLLFVVHLLFIGYLGQLFGSLAKTFDNEDNIKGEYRSIIYLSCLAGAFAIVVSVLLLGLVMTFARKFVQIALIVIISLSFVWGTVGIGVSPKSIVPLTGIIALGVAVAYSFIVWDRIPFASANLLTALSGIRAYPGIILVAFGFQTLTLVYVVTFYIAVVGIYDQIEENRSLKLPTKLTYVIYAMLVLSFYWTYQVIKGIIQAITAGVISAWWCNPADERVVEKSCFETVFYSIGSICFGSLFVGPIRILRQILSAFCVTSNESSSLECLHECIFCVQSCLTSCVQTISAGCNTWAFTYIGMYHYGFLDAGYNATELFDRRGWSTIVSDDLVPNILFLTSLVIGGATGCFAHIISRFVTPEGYGFIPFYGGIFLGLVLTSVLFGMISSAVNAVLVCFAASPVDFEKNHEELSHEMRTAWREVWPGALDACDARISIIQGSPTNFPGSTRFGERKPLI